MFLITIFTNVWTSTAPFSPEDLQEQNIFLLNFYI